MLILDLPLKVQWCVTTFRGEKTTHLTPQPKVKYKQFILNLNNYRNTHRSILHGAKIAYHKRVGELILPEHVGMFTDCQVVIGFQYWHRDRRRIDISNPVSIIEKFTCDALVEHGVIDDDNCEVLTRHDGWEYMGVDKELFPDGNCRMIVEKLI